MAKESYTEKIGYALNKRRNLTDYTKKRMAEDKQRLVRLLRGKEEKESGDAFRLKRSMGGDARTTSDTAAEEARKALSKE
jgi:hypothetical protein